MLVERLLYLLYVFRLLQRQELETLRTTSERLSSEVSELRKQLISEKYEKYVGLSLKSWQNYFDALA